jgi:tetratricopeptide (TPR) repeat protein
VDQSKSSLDKGGSATLDAFLGLAPKESVLVKPALIPRTKSKGPIVRCVSLSSKTMSIDVGNVDSVDKVYRILTRHMKVPVSTNVCECLKWKYRGNGHLEDGKVSLAIDAYDRALAANVPFQEGPVYLQRATAYLQRASEHKVQLKAIVAELIKMLPESEKFQIMYEETSFQPALSNAVFRRIIQETNVQETKFRRTQHRHGLYQYALLHAAQDSLRATELLPQYAISWLRAAEILSELWKVKEAAQYYEKAIALDESLAETVQPIIDRLHKRQELLDSARAFGWNDNTLRLALDVSG